MNFKAQVEHDIKSVFHNTQEFAEKKRIYYNENYFKIPVVLDTEGIKDRQKSSGDNVDGIFMVDVVMYVAQIDLKMIPRQGQNIEIEDDIFKIVSVGNEMGEIVLYLQRLEE